MLYYWVMLGSALGAPRVSPFPVLQRAAASALNQLKGG